MRKDWDRHVADAEEVARGRGFQALRDRIVELADPRREDVTVDVGAGTGLLSLALADRVSKVWAVDISHSMGEYLAAKVESAGLGNVSIATASAVSLPLIDESADLAVSNYCFHHLGDADKRRALAEVHRVLRPGGRFVFADMMFRASVADARDRRVVADKLRTLAARGPAGCVRLARNGVRIALGRWEQPARAGWWRDALRDAGFADIGVELFEHEGGLARARRP